MKDIRSILEHRLADVTIRTSQTTANRFTEWVAQNVADAPDLLSVAWDVWDAATSETESALADAFDKAQTWLNERTLTEDLEDGFNDAFEDHLRQVEFNNWAVINSVDLEWFDKENADKWAAADLGPENYTECLPDLHLGRPHENGPVGPATHPRSYEFAELPIGAMLAWLAADAGADLPRNADYAAIYDLVARAVAREIQTVAGETDHELTWPGLYSLLIDAYGGENPDHAGSLIHQLQQAAAD